MAVETLTALPEPKLYQTGPRVVGVLVSRNGSCETITTYLEGYDPRKLGRLHKGLTGDETIVERVVVRPVRTFLVVEKLTNK